MKEGLPALGTREKSVRRHRKRGNIAKEASLAHLGL